MMATLTQVMLTCDVCGDAKDVQTLLFFKQNTAYEIDLCPKDSKALSNVAAGYMANARKMPAGQSPRRNGRKPRSGTAAIRDKAKASGIKISDRDRAAGSGGKAKGS